MKNFTMSSRNTIVQKNLWCLTHQCIIGQSTGLSPFWVVFAIFLGNGLFGIVGLFIGVPLWAVVYYLIKRYVNYRIMIKEQVKAENIQK